MDELRALETSILPTWYGFLLPLPATVADSPFCQYGYDGHASDVRKIIDSIILNAVTGDGAVASITHLVLDGTSKWVIGRNVTGLGDVRNLNESCHVIPDGFRSTQSLATIEQDMLQYLSMSTFYVAGALLPLRAHVVTTGSAAVFESTADKNTEDTAALFLSLI